MMLAAIALFAQATEVAYPCPAWTGPTASVVGPGIQGPKLVRNFQPEFTNAARAAHVTASRLALSFVISETGQACDIRIASPLGFGLDEAAVEALRKWEFRPAMVDGQPARFKSTAEVSFLSSGHRVIPDEANRTEFNLAINRYASGETKLVEMAIRALEKLSSKRYPPADAYLGYLLYRGENMPSDSKRAVELITRAHKKKAPFGQYAMGLLLAEGKALPADPVKAMILIKSAADMKVPAAVQWLAEQATSGSAPGKTPQ